MSTKPIAAKRVATTSDVGVTRASRAKRGSASLGWQQKLERAAFQAFVDDKQRDFSIAAIEHLAATAKVELPPGSSTKALQTSIVRHVKKSASLCGLRTDGIKVDGGASATKRSSHATRLVALCTAKRWNDERAAKEFGVPLRIFRGWVREGEGYGVYRRLLEILEAPSAAKITPRRATKKEPSWELRTQESRRLHELKTRLGWSVSDLAQAFGAGPRLVYYWLHGHMKPAQSARKILEYYEANF